MADNLLLRVEMKAFYCIFTVFSLCLSLLLLEKKWGYAQHRAVGTHVPLANAAG